MFSYYVYQENRLKLMSIDDFLKNILKLTYANNHLHMLYVNSEKVTCLVLSFIWLQFE